MQPTPETWQKQPTENLFVQLEINCWLWDYELMTKNYVTIVVMREWLIYINCL